MGKTEITKYNVDGKQIKSACMTTIAKDSPDREPSQNGKRKILLAEHSPIRRGIISGKWKEIPTYVSTHFARHHEGCEKFVSTQRADRTNIKDRSERTQIDPVMMEMDANIQAIINISRKRLCHCADPLTTEYGESVLAAIKEYDEDIYGACVPECIRCGGCPEYQSCGFYTAFAKQLTKEEQVNIQTRYDKYNEMRGDLKN